MSARVLAFGCPQLMSDPQSSLMMGRTPRAASSREPNFALLCVAGFAVLSLGAYGFTAYDLIWALFQDFLALTLIDRDFANYWVAGRLVLSEQHLDLFTHSSYFPHLQELFGPDYQIRSWSYPPHYLLFVWPLGLLEYQPAFAAFMGATLLLFALAAALFRRQYAPDSDLRILLLAVLGYVLMMFVAAQNGFLTAGLLLLGVACMRGRPALAGVAFGCLTVKPQLGLLIPILLIFDRNWKTLIWSSLTAAVLVAASVVLFGLASWSAYLTDTLAYQRFVMTDWYGIFLRMMPTVFGSMRTLGFSPGSAANAQLPVTVAALAVVMWLLYRERDDLRRIVGVTSGTFLITPYAFNYDMGALCVCAAVLAGRPRELTPRALSPLPIAMVAAIPAAVTNLGRMGIPCTPIVLAIGLAALVVSAGRVSERRDGTREIVPTES